MNDDLKPTESELQAATWLAGLYAYEKCAIKPRTFEELVATIAKEIAWHTRHEGKTAEQWHSHFTESQDNCREFLADNQLLEAELAECQRRERHRPLWD